MLLFEALTDRDLPRRLARRRQVRYLRDTSSGAGGVSVLGQGPARPLADYNGVFRFPLGQQYHANIVWLGARPLVQPRVHRRPLRRLGASPSASFGAGARCSSPTVAAPRPPTCSASPPTRALGYRYGASRNDVVTAEIIYTTGDANGISDGRYTGVITGNTWGAPAALFTSSGAYLLLPHANVVNRFYSAVFDLSNQGYGLTAATLNASYDLDAQRAHRQARRRRRLDNVAPPGGGHFIGVEGNAMLAYRIRVFLTVELHAAYLHLGDFYDSPREQAASLTTAPAAAGAGARPSAQSVDDLPGAQMAHVLMRTHC